MSRHHGPLADRPINPRSAWRSRTRAPTCTSPAPRSTPRTWSTGPRHCCTPGRCRRRTRTPDWSPGWASTPAYDVPGVVRVLTADDVPGVNDAGEKHDEPLFPAEVMFYGHAVCWVLGETLEAARQGADAIEVEYEPLPVAGQRARRDRGRELPGHTSARSAGATPTPGWSRPRTGSAASSSSAARSTSTWRPTPRWPWSTRTARSSSSPAPSTRPRPRTSSPTCSGWPPIRSPCSACGWAAGSAARSSSRTGWPRSPPSARRSPAGRCSLRLNRTQDITMTGKRHPFLATWEVGFDEDQRIVRAARHADQQRRLEPGPVRAGAGPGAVPHRQRLLDPQHRGARPDRQDQPRSPTPRSAASAARRA